MTVPFTHASFVLIPRFNMMTVLTLIEPMRVANYLAPRPLYSWDFRTAQPGPVTASNGLELRSIALDEAAAPQPDLVIVCASWGGEHHDSPALSRWLRRHARQGKPLLGVELGVYALARAGLMGGHLATTHWSWMPGFAESFPDIDVREQLYTIDGNVMTCAGGTAGLDLMLGLVANHHGDELATEIANQILYHPRRPAEGSQRHTSGGPGADLHPYVRAAMSLLERRIEEPVAVPRLCRDLGVSQRQLERLFRREAGCTIVQFARLLRLQYARVLLTGTAMSIREVSAACGFNSMSYFAQCFLGAFGRKPSEYRQAWPEEEPQPAWPGTAYGFIEQHRLQAAARR